MNSVIVFNLHNVKGSAYLEEFYQEKRGCVDTNPDCPKGSDNQSMEILILVAIWLLHSPQPLAHKLFLIARFDTFPE